MWWCQGLVLTSVSRVLSFGSTSQSHSLYIAGSRSHCPLALLSLCVAKPGPLTPTGLPTLPDQFLCTEKHHFSQRLCNAQLWNQVGLTTEHPRVCHPNTAQISLGLAHWSKANYHTLCPWRGDSYLTDFYPYMAGTQKTNQKPPPEPTLKPWDTNLDSAEGVLNQLSVGLIASNNCYKTENYLCTVP